MSTSRPKAVYFFYNAGLASLVPFMSLHYQQRGMSAAEIGVLAGIIPLITWGSAPFWGGIADARRSHRAVLLLTIGGAWLATIGLYFAHTFPHLLLAVVGYAFFIGPVISLVDNAVLNLLGENRAGYGRVRMWGSFGWALAAILLGPVLERAGLAWTFYGFFIGMAAAFIAATRMPMNVAVTTRQAYTAGLGVLVRNGRFLLLLLTALVFGTSIGVLLSYQILYMEELGASRTLMTLSLAVGTISEIPFWFISARLLRRLGSARMIALALAVATARSVGMALMRDPLWILPISLLHGPSFAMLWTAGVAEADAAAPPGLGATAQGLYSGMIFGLGGALGGFAGGPVAAAIGYAALYGLLGLLTAGMLAVFVAARLRSGYVVRSRATTDSTD